MARKILLADDSVTAQNMGRKILADAGYEVMAVNNGSAALKKIAEFKPDLAILDVYMPGYSGLEVCQRLKESEDTARIPVLLSVGKLEPFKPEEAQRVRAEGYIVKPFEASELLSALAKLEDKIVPRAEPSKPGRFARAIAAAEETDRGNRTAASNEAGGWPNRIGFPQQKTEPEEKVADDAAIYNPMNRDLRTVVETPAEKLAEAEKEQKVEKGEKKDRPAAAETSLDLAALAPAGLPKDVTPEEIAALAAAAARIQAAASQDQDQDKDRGSEVRDSEPVTMAGAAQSEAAANSGASRWTAVPVALEGDEAGVSLDQEMQKAYAAMSAGQNDSAPVATPPEWPAAAQNDEAAVEPPRSEAAVSTEVTSAAISNSEPGTVSEAEVSVSAEATQATSESVQDSGVFLDAAVPDSSSPAPAPDLASDPVHLPVPASVASAEPESAVPQSIAAEDAPVEVHADAAAALAEFMSPVRENRFVETEVAAITESTPLQEPPESYAESALSDVEPAMADTPATPSSVFAPIVRDAEPLAEQHLDPQEVKSTAAAWASWRQIRDASHEPAAAQSNPPQSPPEAVVVPEPSPLPDMNAMAVAAGAEEIPQEASAAAPGDNRADIASIVDSVLAGLRPKLMEEISRKMAQKK